MSIYHKATKEQIPLFLALKIEYLIGHTTNAFRYGSRWNAEGEERGIAVKGKLPEGMLYA